MARGGRPRTKTKIRRFTSRPPTSRQIQSPIKPKTIKLISKKPTTFLVKGGDFISFRTRKGGVQQVRIVSKSTKRSTQFNIPAKRFDRSAKDPRRVGKVAGLGKITRPRKRVKSIRTGRVTVASPSGKAGRTITVSSKSVLATRKRTGGLKGRPRKRKPTGLRSRPKPTRQIKITKRRFGSDFDIFRTFSKTTPTRTGTGRTGRPKPKPPRRRFTRRTRSEFGSDFNVLKF